MSREVIVMSDNGKEEFKPFQKISQRELDELIKLYAAEISEIWNTFRAYVQSTNDLLEKGRIDRDQYESNLRSSIHATKTILSKLLIEQYFNTGEENLFDRAMMLNENIELEDYTVIDFDKVRKCLEHVPSDEAVIIFYRGIFLNLCNLGDSLKKSMRSHLKVIIRDGEEVRKVNKRLLRGRMILQIDEVSIGKKYYEGLCGRTHFVR
jgi:hypothetical protein